MTKLWKRMSSGKYIDLNNLSERDVDLDDITTSLNHTIRFNGHHKDVPPLSVAQHTLLCCHICDMLFPDNPDVKRAVIIHDFGEAFYGDVATPVKKAFGQAFKDFAKPIDDLLDNVFWENAGENGPNETVKECVKVCDLISLDIERRAMWNSQLGKDKWPPTPDIKLSLLDKQAMFDEVKDQYVDFEELLNAVA